MSQKLRLEGKRFGKLTVLKYACSYKQRSNWLCKCDCGNETIVESRLLKSGNVTSCGCVHKYHGMSGTRLYTIWQHMIDRCYNSNNTNYKNYGGRGIQICDEWKDDAGKFCEWALANGYAKDLTLDRIDVNGNYEPGNCRWATRKEQANNKRNNHFLSCNGEIKTITEWERITGISKQTIYKRLKRGWSVERALTEPVKK